MKYFFPTLIITISLYGATVVYGGMDGFAPLERYERGALNVQDGWSPIGNPLLVTDEASVSEGDVITAYPDVGGWTYKAISPELYEAGVLSVSLRIEGNMLAEDLPIFNLFKENTQESFGIVSFRNIPDYETALTISASIGYPAETLGPVTQGTWHTVKIEWKRDDYMLRASLDDGAWTEWFSASMGWGEDDILTVALSLPDSDTYGNFYIKDIIVAVPPSEIIEEDPSSIVLETLSSEDSEEQVSGESAVIETPPRRINRFLQRIINRERRTVTEESIEPVPGEPSEPLSEESSEIRIFSEEGESVSDPLEEYDEEIVHEDEDILDEDEKEVESVEDVVPVISDPLLEEETDALVTVEF